MSGVVREPLTFSGDRGHERPDATCLPRVGLNRPTDPL